jgi:uncharacterized metal-binding protein YceD (DUF177 family)
LDKNSILVTLQNLRCNLQDACDICQKPYERSIHSDFYQAKFIIPEYYKDDDTSDEEIFPINHKDETINIEDMLVQDIVLQDPVIRRCNECTKKDVDLQEEEDDLDYLEGSSNVIFR